MRVLQIQLKQTKTVTLKIELALVYAYYDFWFILQPTNHLFSSNLLAGINNQLINSSTGTAFVFPAFKQT